MRGLGVRWIMLAAENGSGASGFITVGVLAVVGWLLSLILHPWRTCSVCKGQPRSYGFFAAKSFRLCSNCGGNGRELRFGARLFRGK
jgi:hypothetical protein